MFKTFIDNLPSRYFWLANALFWLLLNSMAATNSYRMNLHFNRHVEWFEIWLEYLPWWGNWALLAPLIIASTQIITFDADRLLTFVGKTFGVMLLCFTLYWGLTVVEVALINHGYVISIPNPTC